MDAQLGGLFLPHSESIGIVESDGRPPCQAEPSPILGPDLPIHLFGVMKDRFPEDGRQSGSRILHVNIHLPRFECSMANERTSQVEATLDGHASILEHLGEHLAQDNLLGEIL